MLRPVQQVQIWKILKNLIGQDLRRISLPLVLNEPASGLQRMGEGITNCHGLFKQAANCDDSIRRLVLTSTFLISMVADLNIRRKKPFNPMLGETFEYVHDEYRLLIEKIQHIPKQLSCFCLESEDYTVWGYDYPGNPAFKFAGGKGQLEITIIGTITVYYKKFDEYITFQRPQFMVRNLIFGVNFLDMQGPVTAMSHKTGEKIVYQFTARKSEEQSSHVTASAYTSTGQKVLTIDGCWHQEVHMRDLRTNKTELLFKPRELAENAHLQFFFFKRSVLMNYINDEMAETISPTDSRLRTDIRLFEEANLEQAEKVHVDIEIQQRKVRKQVEDGEVEAWQPRFFKKVAHPCIKESDQAQIEPIMYALIENEGDGKGYWERRENKDWSDMPNLWGPFEHS